MRIQNMIKNMTTKQTLIASLVVGLFMGLVVLLVFYRESPAKTFSSNGSMLTVADQRVSSAITIKKAQLKTPGFVVVYDNTNGFPSGLVGLSDYLEQGVHENVKIYLQAEVAKKTKLVALIREDNGDKTFTAAYDAFVLNEQGKPFEAPFVAK